MGQVTKGAKESAFNRIIAELTATTPPQTAEELAARVRLAIPTAKSYLSQMLNKGLITIEHIPWRVVRQNGPPNVTPAPPPRLADIHIDDATPLGDIEFKLNNIIRQNGPDRVAALGKLMEIRTMSGASGGPPQPHDRPGRLDALTRILSSCPRDIIDEALALAFPILPPPETCHADQVPEEAALRSGDADPGNHLD